MAIAIVAFSLANAHGSSAPGRQPQKSTRRQPPPSAAAPALPKLPVGSFASPMREQIREAHDEVLRRPDEAEGNGRLAMLLYGYEQFQFAETCFERARAFDPKDRRWPYYLGRTQAVLGKHDEAVRSLRAALEHDPGYLPARLALAESLLAAGKLDECRVVYEAVTAQHPDAAAAYYGLGRARAARRDLAGAVELFRKACDLYPSFGAAHYALALAYRDLGDRARAQEHLALYQKDKLGWPPTADPLLGEVEALKKGASAHLKRGVRLEADGNLQAAAEEHERAVEIDPRYVQARVNLITLYGKLGQAEKAAEHYRAAVAIDPDVAESHYNYGVLLAGQQKYAEAAAAFRRALEINPYYAEAHGNYAYLLMVEGRLEESARHYRSALENKPNYRLAHHNLGRILVHEGKLQEAIAHFLETLKPDDEDTPRYTYALGAAYARAGERGSALQYMREARRKAAALGQSDLLGSIEKDLRILESR